MDSREITALRRAAQRIHVRFESSPADVVRHMLAMQAQDLAGARWSVGLRLQGSTDAQVRDELARGAIARSWPMRGTLHLVAPEDLGWMMDIAGPRQATTAAKRRADLEITDTELVRAADVAVGAIADGASIRRDELLRAWEAAGIPTTGQRAYHLIWNLAHQKLIVFGPDDGKQPTFALFEDRISTSRVLERDEALAEFATRYFRSHGPATVRDLAWWASITLGDARRGLAAATGLETREIDGQTYHLAEGLEPASPGVDVLPGFDEYLLGYTDRSAALPADIAPRIVPGNNGVFLPTIVVDGTVVGTWKRSDTTKVTRIDPSEFTTLTKKSHARFEQALQVYGAFLGTHIEIRARA